MKKIVNVLILTITILFSSACNNSRTIYYIKKIDYPEKDFIAKNVRLIIKSTDSLITNKLTLNCKLINESKENVSFWPQLLFNTRKSNNIVFYAEIVFLKSGNYKMGPYIYINYSFPRDITRYINLAPGELNEFSLSIDFNKLVDKTNVWVTEYNNTDYGRYSIKLIYRDNLYSNYENAIKGRVESNEITVYYMKE